MNKANFPNDDLFEGTKMSFGEHLEELRRALFRSVFGIAIGIAIGFWAADHVVTLIKMPLSDALRQHQITKTLNQLKAQYGDDIPVAIESFIREREVVFDSVYMETGEIQRIAKSLEAAPDSSEQETGASENADSGATVASASDSENDSGGAAAKSSETKSKPQDSAGEKNDKARIFGDDMPIPSAKLVHSRIWRPISTQVTALSAQEAFMIWMKAAMVAGIVFASPWVFVQIWNFVAAGLYPHEKNYVYIYLPISLGLFLSGSALAFFFVFQPVLSFLFSFNESMGIGIDARISEWLSFVLLMPLGFGLSFQLPLVMLFLNRIGVFSLKLYIEKWRISILVIFIVSAVLTPMDPISLLLMAVPLTFLYFLGLGLCKWMPSQRNPFSEAYEP